MVAKLDTLPPPFDLTCSCMSSQAKPGAMMRGQGLLRALRDIKIQTLEEPVVQNTSG
jgi:hypothetical protein